MRGHDEVASLALQFSEMISELDAYMNDLNTVKKDLKATKEQNQMMNELAFKDALTGIRNKTAYDSEVRRLEWRIADGYTDFGLAMIDLNFLKRTNDNYGHEKGDEAIKRLCGIVCKVFEHSPVFRIGGDEFVVILEREDFKNAADLVYEFNYQIESIAKDNSLEPWEKISAAIGVSYFNPDSDKSVATVFKRADRAMYTRKKEMKAIREN